MATLPGAWRYRVSAGTGWPGVSILWLGEVESLICSFYLGVAARKNVWAVRSWDTLTRCWDVKQPTKKKNPNPKQNKQNPPPKNTPKNKTKNKTNKNKNKPNPPKAKNQQ